MVEVARILWKFIVGVKDLLALLLLIVFFAALFAMLSASPNPGMVRDGVMLIDLDGFVAEQPAEIDPIETLLSGTAPMREYRARDIVRAVRLAREDDRVKAVALDLDGFLGGGQVSLLAITDELARLQKSGKPVYAYATAYTDAGYQLAAHAGEIWVNPLGGVALIGPGGSQLYYKGLLEKAGVDARIYRVGTFKSAVEPFLRSDQSPEAKEALSAVYAEYWDARLSDIKTARPDAQLDGIFDTPADIVEAAKGDLAQIALERKMVDGLGTRIAFGKMLAKKYGLPTDKDETEIKPGDFASFPFEALLAAKGPNRDGGPIAVITAAGPIVDGQAGAGTAGSATISNLIYKAIADDETKAILLRVDSPGGSVTASEEIRLALNEAKAKKLPVIISMANVAASGGYWISMPADAIFAQPATITGSIGIFGILPSFEGALQKVGISADGVKTTPLSGEPDMAGGIGPQFDRVMQALVEDGYGNFLSRVAEARGKTVAEVDAIAQGRIWAGGTARQLGLVDRLGGMDEALAEAAKLAKLEKGEWHARYYEPEPGFLAALVSTPTGAHSANQRPMDLFARSGLAQQQLLGVLIRDLAMLAGTQGMQAYCMECGGISSTSAVVPNKAQAKDWAGALQILAQ